jgi:hypothetical protein
MKRNRLSNWREDLREIVDVEPKTDKKSERKIDTKKVQNKVVINPAMTEAFEKIGATILEMEEVDEETLEEKLSKEELEKMQDEKDKKEGRVPGRIKEDLAASQMKRAKKEGEIARIDMKIAKERKKLGKEAQTQPVQEKIDLKKADMGEVITDFRKSDAPQFKGKSDKKIQKMAIAAKLEAERGPQNEGLSIDDQMRISRDYNRKSPEEKKAMNQKALGTIKKVKREKDTRTDAQKMTDATGPRPGSRYRGD